MTFSARLFSCLCLSSWAAAQFHVRFEEVLVDPVGVNAGAQVVELINEANRPIDLTGYHLGGAGVLVPMPPITLPIGQITRVFVGAAGASDPANIYLPTMPTLGSSDALALLSSSDINDPAALVDFVSWGRGQYLIGLAVRAGQWPSTLVSARVPAEGESLAHYGPSSFVGPDAPDSWFVDGTPTLGLPNDPGAVFSRALGCPWLAQGPGLGLARVETRPWIGERFEVDVFNLPASAGPVLMAFGVAHLPATPLDVIGMPGCAWHVSIDVLVPLPSVQGLAVFATVLPRAPSLVFANLHAQAIVLWAGAGNQAQAVVTNSAVFTIGSR